MRYFYILFFILLFSINSIAKVELFCWTSPELPPAQGVELNIKSCSSSKNTVGNLNGSQVKKEVLCIQNVQCEALTPSLTTALEIAAKQSMANIKSDEVYKYIKSTSYGVRSILTCKGTAHTVDNVTTLTCPKPNDCKDEVLYKMSTANLEATGKAIKFKTNFSPRETSQ